MVYNESGSRDIMVFSYILQARIYMLEEYERVSPIHRNAKLGEDYLSYGKGAGLILRENSLLLSLACTPKDYADKDSGLIQSGSYSLVRTSVLAKCVKEWKDNLFVALNHNIDYQKVDEQNIDDMLRRNRQKISNIFSRLK